MNLSVANLALVVLTTLRSLAIAGCAAVLGLAVAEAHLYFTGWRTRHRQRLFFMGLVRVGIALSMIYMAISLAQKLTYTHLTWRLPLALGVDAFLVLGMIGILYDDEVAHEDHRGR